MTGRLGVCSWSLAPSSPRDLAEKASAAGVRWVQLALDPMRTGAWDEEETSARLRDAGIGIASGMMAMEGEDYTTLESIRRTGGLRPDETWDANLQAARANAALARRLGLSLVSFHAGFLPHDAHDPERPRLLARLAQVATAFAEYGVRVALETGQEHAATLLEALRDLGRPDVGVNFDPANMILYGMGDPVAAFEALAPRVLQAHVKDARPPVTKGAWGTEVPVGTGAARWPELLRRMDALRPGLDLMIEREAGAARLDDIRTARVLVERETSGTEQP